MKSTSPGELKGLGTSRNIEVGFLHLPSKCGALKARSALTGRVGAAGCAREEGTRCAAEASIRPGAPRSVPRRAARPLCWGVQLGARAQGCKGAWSSCTVLHPLKDWSSSNPPEEPDGTDHPQPVLQQVLEALESTVLFQQSWQLCCGFWVRFALIFIYFLNTTLAFKTLY